MERTLRLGEWTVVGRGWFQKRLLFFAGESSPGIYSVRLSGTEGSSLKKLIIN